MTNKLITFLVVPALLFCLSPMKGNAQEIEVPATVQFPILANILNFDRSLRAHKNSTITFAILYESNVKISDAVADELLDAIQHAGIDSIMKTPVEYITINLSDERDLKRALTKHHVDVLYLTPMRSLDIPELLSLCREYSILTMTGVLDYIDLGVAVCIGKKRNRPEIIINLPEAKAEGADLSSRLLKIATIIR